MTLQVRVVTRPICRYHGRRGISDRVETTIANQMLNTSRSSRPVSGVRDRHLSSTAFSLLRQAESLHSTTNFLFTKRMALSKRMNSSNYAQQRNYNATGKRFTITVVFYDAANDLLGIKVLLLTQIRRS